jgi:hypothetical protein
MTENKLFFAFQNCRGLEQFTTDITADGDITE